MGAKISPREWGNRKFLFYLRPIMSIPKSSRFQQKDPKLCMFIHYGCLRKSKSEQKKYYVFPKNIQKQNTAEDVESILNVHVTLNP